jgi:uncharacterized protein (DUF1800 family)
MRWVISAICYMQSHVIRMVIYLDGARNKKCQPNENFAREEMELFTLGQGRYSERDVKEAARIYRVER